MEGHLQTLDCNIALSWCFFDILCWTNFHPCPLPSRLITISIAIYIGDPENSVYTLCLHIFRSRKLPTCEENNLTDETNFELSSRITYFDTAYCWKICLKRIFLFIHLIFNVIYLMFHSFILYFFRHRSQHFDVGYSSEI